MFRKIEQDNCFIIQQIVSEKYFTVKNKKKLCTNRGSLRISQDICYVRMTGNKDVLHDHIWASCGHGLGYSVFERSVPF